MEEQDAPYYGQNTRTAFRARKETGNNLEKSKEKNILHSLQLSKLFLS